MGPDPESLGSIARDLTRPRLTVGALLSAEQRLRHAMNRDGAGPAYASLLARVLKRIGKYNEALTVLTGCLAHFPDSAQLHAGRGDLHFSRRHYSRAAECYARALAAREEDSPDPVDWIGARGNLALSRCHLGEPASAAGDLHSLLVANPGNPRVIRYFASALAKNHSLDTGTMDLSGIDPGSIPELKISLCQCLLDEKRYYDAFRCSGQLEAEQPRHSPAIRCRARVLFRLMQLDGAIRTLQNAVDSHYADVAVYRNLCNYYKAANRGDLARETCLKGLSLFPGNPNLLISLFLCDNSAGRLTEAGQSLITILAIPGAFRQWQKSASSSSFLFRLAWKYYGTLVFPETEEGKFLEECFRAANTASQVDFIDAHDPEKVIFPNSEQADLPDTFDFSSHFANNAVVFADGKSLRCNIVDGSRVVVNQPENHSSQVFLCGLCCSTLGWSDSASLASALQDIYNSRSGGRVKVISYGKHGRYGFLENTYLRLVHSHEVRQGDTVLLYEMFPTAQHRQGSIYDNSLDMRVAGYAMLRNTLNRMGARLYLAFTPILALDAFRTARDDEIYQALRQLGRIPSPDEIEYLTAAFSNRLIDNGFSFSFFNHVLRHKTPDESGAFWYDDTHYSMSLNWPLAEAMHDFLSLPAKSEWTGDLPDLEKQSMNWLHDLAYKKYCGNEAIRAWINATYDPGVSNHGNVGAIVMNCNPFTLGHRYLVEQALDSVEALYLFVVEEDLSQFSFADRLMLVEEGVKDLRDRVKVMPSGKFIISSFSFAGYFSKECEIVPPDSTTDLLIFASVIAPALNIRTRFVGEEPICAVTLSYNERMQLLLPDMGVAVRVIPRKEAAGAAISASRVRRALAENDLRSLKSLVPDTTYNYLTKRS